MLVKRRKIDEDEAKQIKVIAEVLDCCEACRMLLALSMVTPRQSLKEKRLQDARYKAHVKKHYSHFKAVGRL